MQEINQFAHILIQTVVYIVTVIVAIMAIVWAITLFVIHGMDKEMRKNNKKT